MAPTAHCVPCHPEQFEHHPDDDQNDANGDQDGDRGQQPDDEQNDAQNDHASPPLIAKVMLWVLEPGVPVIKRDDRRPTAIRKMPTPRPIESTSLVSSCSLSA